MFLEAGGGRVPGAVPGLGLGAELGNIPYLHAEWLRGDVSPFLSSSALVLPAFLPHLPHSTVLSAVASALLCEPPVPASFSSPRAAGSLFLLWFSATLGVPASWPPQLLSWGCCAQVWWAGPRLSDALSQATFFITLFLLLFCTLGTFHE